MNVLTFKIETVPDVELGKRLYDLHDLSDEDVTRVMIAKCREQEGPDGKLALHMQRIAAISALYRDDDSIKVWSLGDVKSNEKHLIQHFFAGIEKYTPTLVSWNGSRHDLPVIHYRALKYGISSKIYWDKENNYHGRFHSRHVDLMDTLSGHQQPGLAPLNEIALMLDLPASSSNDTAESGDIDLLRQQCETDVLNIWLVYLHWLHLTTALDDAGLANECQVVKESLLQENLPHLTEYLKAWNEKSV